MKSLAKILILFCACFVYREIAAISVAVEAPVLDGVASEHRHIGPNLVKNLCGRLISMRSMETVGCGVGPQVTQAHLRIVNTVKEIDGRLTLHSALSTTEGANEDSVTTVSGAGEYHAMTLELHTEKLIQRLEEISANQPTKSKSAVTKAEIKSEPKQHDGFFLSVYTGSGWVQLGALHSGIPIFAGLKIGRTLWDTLFLFGSVEVALIDSPIIEKHTRLARDGKYTTFAGNLDGTATSEDFSLGWGFYTRSNYVFQAALGLGAFQIRPADSPAAQNYGNFESSLYPSLSLSFGREWWVSDNWGVGLALIGRSVFAAPEWALSLALAVTATYN
ncbi:MAG: hypothetical protein JNJ69_11465 [Leptospiraceae bacterium]|nr:hypothetical protein [Leptospiraceae bacterium]